MEVLVVGNTAYVDDDFCAKAFPGEMTKQRQAEVGTSSFDCWPMRILRTGW